MSPKHELTTRFSPETAAEVARRLYGLEACATPLPGERDENFRLDLSSGESVLLKIAAAGDDRALLEMQDAALRHIAAKQAGETLTGSSRSVAELPVQRVVGDGGLRSTKDALGRPRWVRLLSWLPGLPLARVRPRSRELLQDLGRKLGLLHLALADFEHPVQTRDLKWDLSRGLEIARELVHHVPDPGDRALAEGLLEELRERLDPVWSGLRRAVIHNDANDHNVLVDLRGTEPRISGLIDFGDMLWTVRVAELAIAAAYVMLDEPEPLLAAAAVVEGYQETGAPSLDELEIKHLFDLVRLRLLVSVANSAHQRVREPHNEYLTVSEAPAWRLLRRLEDVPRAWATAVFRDSLDRQPFESSAAVVRFLDRSIATTASVVGPDLRNEPAVWLDLSISSPDLARLEDDADLEAWNDLIARRLKAADASVAFGRYDEPRLAYTTDAFRQAGFERDEWRTIHLGIDVFVAAGTTVQTPLDAVVHSFQENVAPRDYGPTVILEHRTDEGVPFWTLYGHLGRGCLDALEIGRRLEAGEHFAEIGEQTVNGGWPPHLHFQVMTDLLGRAGDFPGVGAASLRNVWRSLCPSPAALLGVSPPEEQTVTADRIRRERQEVLGPSLSLSYRRPLHFVKGRGVTLFDATGQPFLDTVNNVCHVGHCHPRVVQAGQQQMAVLNTNTRYLHETIVRYARRLAAKLPDPLEVCFFVCSGSEANELALRLARAHTGQRDVLVIEGGYHGNTRCLVELSHYKFAGPGGQGPGEGVHVLPMPDPYRGCYRGSDVETGRRYAAHATEIVAALRSEGRAPAAFLGEAILSCGGQIEPPERYLEGVYAAVRGAGGVCIADEVQTGFGRVGSHFWAFERQGVVPDIVTLGKPIGNGHPLAAVVTTRAIADSFANGMEYFNTFGGNPVSCAIGEAVLDVIEEERLQERARRLGSVLERGLRDLQQRFELIGDVRGAGLFLGVELVRDRETLEPDARAAKIIKDRMRDLGILTSTDGPDDNVIKIKPPLVFSEADVAPYCETLERILDETALAGPRVSEV